MKTSSYFSSKVKENFEKFFEKSVINRLSKASKFSLRKDAKITPLAFVIGLIDSCSTRFNSYSCWASAIASITGKEVSKQALFKRMNDRTELFASKLFSHILNARLKVLKQDRLFDLFARVLLGDSTTLSLPKILAKDFPGNISRGEQKAVARLQCIINIKSMQWLDLSLNAFTNNDQSASANVLSLLRKGDLLIRDLGYFVLKVLGEIINKKAFFISRLKYGITLYNEAGKEMAWKNVCRRKCIVDRKILIGKKEMIPVRIIMIPLPAKQAEERIRKAKKDRDKRLNHSNEYYQWLKYNVFITNVEEDTLCAKEIAEVYKIRWQIEILFKSWKSGGHLQTVLHEGCTNIHRVKTTIYLLLMFFCLIMEKVYLKYHITIEKELGRYLSLIKIMAYVCNNLMKVLNASTRKLKEQLIKHCCYEQRHDRVNMAQLINRI
ncbi:MAG TPA: IS4 family transposase [Segetibacter sp.]|jgi:hypothetical protein|nr:IS4 family transposase [Segetibacter sp.]